MLANNIRRASAILSRQRKTLNLAKRCLSSKTSASSSSSTPDAKVSKDNSSNNANAAPKYTAPRGLPTRHSRHHNPTVAPADVLDASSQKIIASMPGTLFSYNSKNLHQSKMEEYEQALNECHALQQKVEYLLRGYSALLPGSMVDIASDSEEKTSTSGNSDGADEIIGKMMKLLDRMEQEGKTYVELRSKFRSQLARVSDNANSNANADSNEDAEVPIDENTSINAWKMNSLIANFGAPPGPTSTMYDLILDAIAVTVTTPSSKTPLSLLQSSRELHAKAAERYELDAKAGTEGLNPSSCPTPATFNAVIRAATIGTEDEEIRDTAIENGFYAFNTIYHHSVVHRNSSTYKYILDMIGAHFPPGEMRGNIVAGIWEKAVQDKVVDLTVFEAMRKVGSAQHGELFDGWWKSVQGQFEKDGNGHGFPIVWGKNKKLRRFDKRFDTY